MANFPSRPSINKILIDANIPFINGVLEPYCREVKYLLNHEFTPDAVRDAEALIVRTHTRCNEELLKASQVQLIATATIGMDHIDVDWCKSAGIRVANAPGCNAPAVGQWVFGALARLINRPIDQYTLGIVGVGHVGGLVARWARSMDMHLLCCDPPRQERGDGEYAWVDLETLAKEADIVTFHVPLDSTTRHMANERLFNQLRRTPIFLNAARGPVVDTPALIRAIESGRVSKAAIDTWEGEPRTLDHRLLDLVEIGTPHIAGYSFQGKVRATAMVLEAVSRHFHLPELNPVWVERPQAPARTITLSAAMSSYDPLVDTAALRRYPDELESLRDHYTLRQEIPDTQPH